MNFSFFNKKPLIKGIILTIISYFFLGLSSVFVKKTTHDLSIWQILFWQNLICLLLSLYYFYRNKTLNFKVKKISLHIYRGIFGTTCYWAFYKTLSLLDLVNATVLTYLAPFFVPFISHLWIKEPMEKKIWASLSLGFLGMLIILKPGDNLTLGWGFLIGIISAVTTAASIVSIRVLNTKGESLSSMLIYFFLSGIIISLPLAISDWTWLSFNNFIFMLCVGILTFIGQILFNIAYSYGTAVFLSPLCYFIILFNFIFSWFFFNVLPHWNAFLGSFLIILGGTITILMKSHSSSFPEILSQKAFQEPRWKKLVFWRKK